MKKFKDTIKSYSIITLGIAIMAVGIYFFKFPNNFSTGGVSGMSTILGELVPNISKAAFVNIINYSLLVLGLIFFGRGFAFKTVYSSVVLSSLIAVFEYFFPLKKPLTDQPFLELVCSILLVGVGSALLFSERASSGGTDIVAMILKKFTKLNIGKALFCSDFVIVLVSFAVFGIETGIFSMLGLLSKALVVDNIIDSIYLSKCVTIVTDNPAPICDYLTRNINRSATAVKCEGVFTHKDKTMLITVLTRSQTVGLKDFIKQTDPTAFIMITNSSDVLGKGFRENVG